MKRIICIVLALVLALSLAACGKEAKEASGNAKIQSYVDKNKDELIQSMEYSFAQSSGMTCSSEVKVVGTGIVVNININELDNLTDDQRRTIQDSYTAMEPSMQPVLEQMQTELPELTSFTINVRECDGDHIAKMVID